ncbi:MAG TPA: hypothetical protein VFT80_02600 [Actinomycetota bacterium]|nr:hypothetical protein [Actinomycetota bacterium]
MRRPGTRLAIGFAIALVAALAMGPAATAKGPPTGGESPNNLSVPTIMIGDTLGATCTSLDDTALPTGTPSSGYPIDPTAYYYVQGVHSWQADCATATTGVKVSGAWGDNLSGDAKLKAGKPIRVELGLFESGDPLVVMNGFDVDKLEPDALDRESAYGTLATANADGTFHGTPTAFSPVRVYVAGVTFSVKNLSTGTYAVPIGTPPTAEINAVGAVVYGYNLRVSVAGTYQIVFWIPANVTITGTDAGTYDATAGTFTLDINVVAGGGGGGRPR